MLRNVLIFHLGALGDFVVTWPMLLALSRLHPQSRIVCITHPQKGALAERVLRIESASIEGGWHHLFGDASALPQPAARLLAGAHSVYSFIAAEGDAWTANVRKLAPQAEVCCIAPRPDEAWTSHVTEYHLSQLDPRKAAAGAMRAMLQSIADRGTGFPTRGSAAAVIHPGSGSPAKCWPLDRFLQLAGILSGRGMRVRFVVGETEVERWPAVQLDALAAAGEVRRPATLLELLDALSDASVYVGNDSGPSHLAGIIGLPAACLFGLSKPAVWRPLGPRVTVVPNMHQASAEQVAALIA